MHTLLGNINGFPTEKPAFAIGFLLSSAVGLLFYLATARTIEKDAQERFNSMARSVQSAIDGRVKSYSDVLRGTASLFQTSPDLTREQFHRYVEGLSLEKEFPGIEAINFARYVTDAERPGFEARMRGELAAISSGYPPFRITPPGRRASYVVITYIEPIAAWSNRFGVDLTGRGVVPSHEKSRDTGELQAANTPLTFLNGTNRTGLSMRLPIYRPGMRAVTVEERRAAYFGTVGIGFTVQKMIEGLLEQMPVRGVRLILTDIGPRADGARPGPAGSARVLSDSSATMAIPAPPAVIPDGRTFVTTLPVGFTMRAWEAQFSIRKSNLHTRFDAYAPWLAMLAGFVSTLLLYSLFHALSSSRRNAVSLAEGMTTELRASETKLQLLNENLRRLGAHAEIIKEEERKRIAREIHDDLGQNLLALRIEADILSVRTGERHPRLHARVRATVSQIDATIKSVRQIINDLRPNVLDLGLNAAVEWQIAEFRRRTGIKCDLRETHQDIAIDDHCATALFRILQESLSNIQRHAQATRVQVVLQVKQDSILMSVGDNGIGLHSTGHRKPGSFGLVGIEERINILGGTFEVHSVDGSGTTIRVEVPMRHAEQVHTPLYSPVDAYARGTELV
ncbi:MAG: histidine kinase [Massilia sp.]|jgi:signal transduction histidine kinase|nr:histidine kinase [Massilia sp.]MDB5950177.1 histidine kinase [Massilia sp.]